MKPFSRIVRIAKIFIKKDWTEFRKPIGIVTGGLLIPVLLLLFGDGKADLARGMIVGILMAGPFLYAQSCFFAERQQGTLDFLVMLPVTRMELALAKFASLFSMILFSVNVPGVMLGDARMLFYANAASLFAGSVFMASTVVSSKPWAPQIPFWAIILMTAPFHRSASPEILRWVMAHGKHLAVTALALTPGVVLGSAWLFSREEK